MSEISRFIEKPDPKTARRLTRAGELWNTMIMVFKTKTMLDWVSRLAPNLYRQFQQVYEAIGMPGESAVLRKTYQGLKPMNFSKEFLEPLARLYPSSLLVLPVGDLLWSDWGTASRIMDVLAKIGKVPRPTAGKKAASGYPFLGKLPFDGLPFDGDIRSSEVAVQK